MRLPKIALVVGNGRYRNAPLLKNPANDANVVGEVLKAAGFEVTLRLDSSRAEMAAAIHSRVQTLARKQCVGRFYFAGHGLQLAWCISSCRWTRRWRRWTTFHARAWISAA